MGEELKPCPFCGGTNQLVLTPTCKETDPYDPADLAVPVIRCMGCYTDVPGKNWDHKGTSAVEKWNRRAALSGMAEPVAFAEKDGDDWITYWPETGGTFEHIRDYPHLHQPNGPMPLFTTPPASGLREENERLRKALEPFAAFPLHGIHGGPLCTAKGVYEDGSDENTARHRGSLDPSCFRAARAALNPEGK